MLIKNGISFSRKLGQESLNLSLSRASCTQGSSPSLCRKLCVAGRELSPWLCSRAISSCVCVRERERERKRENVIYKTSVILIPYYFAFYAYPITCCSYLITCFIPYYKTSEILIPYYLLSTHTLLLAAHTLLLASYLIIKPVRYSYLITCFLLIPYYLLHTSL
jgi:hypothetical protein